MNIIAAFVISLIIAFIVVSIFKSQMKSAIKATRAEAYKQKSKVDITIREDKYTHTTETREKIDKK